MAEAQVGTEKETRGKLPISFLPWLSLLPFLLRLPQITLSRLSPLDN